LSLATAAVETIGDTIMAAANMALTNLDVTSLLLEDDVFNEAKRDELPTEGELTAKSNS